jgi:hypothetical protein
MHYIIQIFYFQSRSIALESNVELENGAIIIIIIIITLLSCYLLDWQCNSKLHNYTIIQLHNYTIIQLHNYKPGILEITKHEIYNVYKSSGSKLH